MKRIPTLGLLLVMATCNCSIVVAQGTVKEGAQTSQRPLLSFDQAILEEYKALRAEIILCLDRRVTIVSLGFAAVGVLLAAGVSLLSREKDNWLSSSLIIGIGVTLTAFYVFDVWMVETQRLARASAHNYYLEEKLKKLYPGDVMPIEWEHRIRSSAQPYVSLLTSDTGSPWIFLVLSGVSAICGVGLFWRGTKDYPRLIRWRIPVGVICVLLLGWGQYVRWHLLCSLSEIWKLTPS